MTIYFFTKGDKHVGSSRQRVYFVADELRARGWETHVYTHSLTTLSLTPWPRKALLIIDLAKTLLWRAQRDDIFFVHKGIFNKYFLILLTLARFSRRRRIVTDFDDAVFMHAPYKTKFLLRLSDVVLAGSHYIYSWAQQRHASVYLLPTAVAYDTYAAHAAHKTQSKKVPNIGWVGHGPLHLTSLRHIVPVFRKLLSLGEQFSFTLVGSLNDQRLTTLFAVEGLPVRIVDNLDWYNPHNVAREIQTFDIGIMPLEDLEIEKGKCAFKAIEYMACGVPTVCSDIGENRYLIHHGVNGFLVKDWSDWVPALQTLLHDADLRARIGAAGQQTIRERYSFKVTMPQLIAILEKHFT